MLTTKILTDIIGLALFMNWLIWWFTPLNKFREKIIDKLVNTMVEHKLWFMQPFILVFTCVQCSSFWVALICFQNLTFALITSFLAVCFEMVLKYRNKIIE